MAWIDDRIWCHPKFTKLSAPSFAVYVKGIAYSSGLSTRGTLDQEQQRLIGSTAKTRGELIERGLWEMNGDGSTVQIHDWDDHNGKRDERREKERARKRAARWKGEP